MFRVASCVVRRAQAVPFRTTHPARRTTDRLASHSPFGKVFVVSSQGQFEQLVTSVAALGRDELKKRIKDFRGRFKLDFSDAYLDSLSSDRLRHILLAALINARARS
jgi:hypothetical protein